MGVDEILGEPRGFEELAGLEAKLRLHGSTSPAFVLITQW
jgi:hypothetical protein